jgi:hypothetical protein
LSRRCRFAWDEDAWGDGWRAGRKRDSGDVRGHGEIERSEAREHGRVWVLKRDCARVWRWSLVWNRGLEGRAQLVRSNKMGVRHVSPMPRRTELEGHDAVGRNSRRACWQHDCRLVHRLWDSKQCTEDQQGSDGISEPDDSRVERWAGGIHGPSAGDAHGWRADDVGVGYLCALPGRERADG